MSTISLHNIRYELAWRGDELWKVAPDHEELVGSVRQNEEMGRWEGELYGRLVIAAPTAQVVRHVLETRARRVLEPDTDLT